MHEDNTQTAQDPFVKKAGPSALFSSVALVITVAVATTVFLHSRQDANTTKVQVKGRGNQVIVKGSGSKARIQIEAYDTKLLEANGRSCADYPNANVCLHSDSVLAIRSKDGAWDIIAGAPNARDRETIEGFDRS